MLRSRGISGMQCSFCERDLEGETVYQHVSGWERWRDEGGTNALALRQTEQDFACMDCIESFKRGVDPTQQTTLGIS